MKKYKNYLEVKMQEINPDPKTNIEITDRYCDYVIYNLIDVYFREIKNKNETIIFDNCGNNHKPTTK